MPFHPSVKLLFLTGMVWSLNMDFFRPVRKYVFKRTYFRRFRRMLKDSSNEKDKNDQNSSCCPSCRSPFDKGKKRKLIDTCGHTRCYTCIFTTDRCPLCQPQAQSKTQQVRRPSSYFFPRPFMVQNRPNSISVVTPQQLSDLEKESAFCGRQLRNRASFLGKNTQGHQEIHSVEIHSHMDMEQTENFLIPKQSFTSSMRAKGRSLPTKPNSRSATKQPIESDHLGSLVSMSSQRDLMSSCKQNLRSREQSVTSLMSISSRSSSTPTDILKHLDEKIDGPGMGNQRFSLIQSSNVSLDLSIDARSNLSSEKAISIPLRLKPLYFEVPQPQADAPFVGRQWLFNQLEKTLLLSDDSKSQGVSLIGGPGTGKTSIILQLVDYSPFGRKWERTLSETTQDIYWKIKDLTNSSMDGDQMSVSSQGSAPRTSGTSTKDSLLYQLASKVVGYHFCQADYNATCAVADFVHSLAAQLCQAPLLTEYRCSLMKDPKYQNLLCMDSCLADPDKAFSKGILEPLSKITPVGSLQSNVVLLVIDSLHEAEGREPKERDTISSFLAKHISFFPKWLKVIVTARDGQEGLLSSLPFNIIRLDSHTNSSVQQDLLNYVQYRINDSCSIQRNVIGAKKEGEEYPLLRFAEYISSVSNGSFLYLKLTLDLLHQGHLVIKSSSFSVLPINLNQVFLLIFNLKFTSNSSFDKVNSILNLCLASLYPLTVLEVYHSLNARYKLAQLTWYEFLQNVEDLTSSHILVHRLDGSLMISYPCLREWLASGDDCKKFHCDTRQGHINLALRMARLEAPLSPLQGLEFAHHLHRANMFMPANKAFGSNAATVKNLEALWLQHCLLDPTASLAHEQNAFSPNIEVSRMLLQAKANPNVKMGIRNEIPLLNLAADKELQDFIFLLLEFGADANIQNLDDGITPLMTASRKGNDNIIQILLSAKAKVYLKDSEGKTALTYAAEKGNLDIIKVLMKSGWPQHFALNAAINTAFVTASGKGHLEVCQYFLSECEVQLNSCDAVSGHTAFTASSWQGHAAVCKLLLNKGATVVAPSRTGVPPIIWAVRGSHLDVVEILSNSPATIAQTDKEGRTSLMWAATDNSIEILKFLLGKGVATDAKDIEGLTALAWAASENSIEAAQCLLDNKANVESLDIKGRTPLFLAMKHKDGEMVSLLLKHGSNMEQKDYSGATPLEAAINVGNIMAVSKLLHQGVKIGPKIWCSAQEQPNMLLVLMHKLLSDGVVLYKKEKLEESTQRFLYALKKFPSENLQGEKKLKFKQLKFFLHLGLSKSHRKLDEYDLSIQSANDALKIKPKSYEALYVRAKAKHEKGNYEDALLDVTEALRVAHSDARIVQTLQSLRADILTSSKIVCPLDGIEIDNQKLIVPEKVLSNISKLTETTSQTCRTLEQQRSSLIPQKTFVIQSERAEAVH